MGNKITCYKNQIIVTKTRNQCCGCFQSRKHITYTITRKGIRKNINNENCFDNMYNKCSFQ